MLSRAERRTTEFIPTSTTSEEVGPGSYALTKPYQPLRGPSAAFAWTGTRSAAAPLPTAEDADAAAASSPGSSSPRPWTTSSNISSSCFASSTQRFAADKEAVAKPGPGAYQTSPKWVKHQPFRHASSSAAAAEAAARQRPSTALMGECAVRMPAAAAGAGQSSSSCPGSSSTLELLLSTPPSIPARHQSFGFETGPDGRLTMQPPPPPPAAAAATKAAETQPSVMQGKKGSSSLRPKSPARPGSLLHSSSSSKLLLASAAAAVARGQPPKQLQQELQAAGQHPATSGQQQDGSGSSPRFRCAAGGKLVLSKGALWQDRAAGSAAFASTSARLHQQEPDPDKATPGPGTYATASSSSRLLSGRPTTAPGSSSYSRTYQPFARTSARRSTAGVSNTLTSPQLIRQHQQHHHHRQQQPQPLFARSAGRSAALSAGPGWSLPPCKSVAPGPGSYNLRGQPASTSSTLLLGAAAAAATSAGGFKAGSRLLGGGSQQGCRTLSAGLPAEAASSPRAAAAAAATGGFGCSSHRGLWLQQPLWRQGPGMYSADQLLSMSADAARRAAAASRRGAFGSAAGCRAQSQSHSGSGSALISDCLGRGGGSSGGSGAPGPGCYDVRSGLADRAAAAAERPSAGFVSSSERFSLNSLSGCAPIASPDYATFDGSSTLRGDQTRLGPGAYIQLDDWRRGGGGSATSYHSAPFGSDAGRQRFASTSAQADAAPGPGAYASVDISKVFQPLSLPGKSAGGAAGGGFATTAQRFKAHAPTPCGVGPGSYHDGQQQLSSLVRPSFNVTLDR